MSTKSFQTKSFYPHVSVAYVGEESQVLAVGMVSSIVFVESKANKFSVLKLVQISRQKGLSKEAVSCFRFISKHLQSVEDIHLIVGYKSGLICIYSYRSNSVTKRLNTHHGKVINASAVTHIIRNPRANSSQFLCVFKNSVLVLYDIEGEYNSEVKGELKRVVIQSWKRVLL